MAKKKGASASIHSESKSKSAPKTGASSSAPPPTENIIDPEVLKNLPGLVYDHVSDQSIFTETLKKEDKALARLADLQRAYDHMEYKPNPFNKSKILASFWSF